MRVGEGWRTVEAVCPPAARRLHDALNAAGGQAAVQREVAEEPDVRRGEALPAEEGRILGQGGQPERHEAERVVLRRRYRYGVHDGRHGKGEDARAYGAKELVVHVARPPGLGPYSLRTRKRTSVHEYNSAPPGGSCVVELALGVRGLAAILPFFKNRSGRGPRARSGTGASAPPM